MAYSDDPKEMDVGKFIIVMAAVYFLALIIIVARYAMVGQ